MYSLKVEVVEIRGHCPVYNTGESFMIEGGYQLVSDGPLCMHALQSISPYYVALSRGIKAEKLGLSGPEEGAVYLQCLDPVNYTGGGTVTFKITREKDAVK